MKIKTWKEVYDSNYKKLKSKQKKFIDSLSYIVEWSGDMISREEGKFDIFNHLKVKALLTSGLSKNGILENEDIRTALLYAYMSKREYELWENKSQINSLYYDVIEPQLDAIYDYVNKTVNINL